jgi:ribosomal-protein-serine acetyltransferase
MAIMRIELANNVALEPLSVAHSQRLYDLTEANRAHLRQWLPWLDHIQSLQDTAAFVQSVAQQSTRDGVPNVALFHHGKLCGVAGFHAVKKMHGSGSIGYWLAQGSSGQGVVSTAVRELLRIGFSELKLNKIEIHCAVHNLKSRAIPERLGFQYEGSLRQCEWLYTHFVDHAIYSLLVSEYAQD